MARLAEINAETHTFVANDRPGWHANGALVQPHELPDILKRMAVSKEVVLKVLDFFACHYLATLC